MNHRRVVFTLWMVILATALYGYFFHRDALQRLLGELSASRPSFDVAQGAPRASGRASWIYAVYLALGCLRGFTLIPATYLVVAGMLVLPPVPLYLLTVVGIIVSSAAVYYFAEAMQFDKFFEKRYAPQVARLRALMTKRELPIVIIWSFFPIAPTDLICYVCGALKVDLKKCLFGVTLGEGTICAIYIFLGGQALSWLR